MAKAKEPPFDTFHCLNPLVSPLPVYCSKSWWKWPFPVPTSSKTTMMRESLKHAVIGLIVLHTIPENN